MCTGSERSYCVFKKTYYNSLAELRSLMDAGYMEPYINLFATDVYEYGLSDNVNAKKYLQLYLETTYDPDEASRLEGL